MEFSAVNCRRRSRETPLGSGANKDGCFRRLYPTGKYSVFSPCPVQRFGLLHITCQTPIVIARWSLSGKHQHGRLVVIILLRVGCRKKYIFLVFSKRKFRKVKRTVSTPSRQHLNRFSWNLASLLSDIFPRKSCRRFLFSFSVFE